LEESDILYGDQRFALFPSFISSWYECISTLIAGDESSKEITRDSLFEFGFSSGKSLAGHFFKKFSEYDVRIRVACLSSFFRYCGFGCFDICRGGVIGGPTVTKILITSPNTIESEEQLRNQASCTQIGECRCNCHFQSGLLSGWLSESFSFSVMTVEVLCRSRGDDCCMFLAAESSLLAHFLQEFMQENSMNFTPEIFPKYSRRGAGEAQGSGDGISEDHQRASKPYDSRLFLYHPPDILQLLPKRVRTLCLSLPRALTVPQAVVALITGDTFCHQVLLPRLREMEEIPGGHAFALFKHLGSDLGLALWSTTPSEEVGNLVNDMLQICSPSSATSVSAESLVLHTGPLTMSITPSSEQHTGRKEWDGLPFATLAASASTWNTIRAMKRLSSFAKSNTLVSDNIRRVLSEKVAGTLVAEGKIVSEGEVVPLFTMCNS
jgi:predicted hydrocarbon binding protein